MDLFVDFTLRQLILNNIYIGHRRTFSNSSLFRLLLGERNGLYIFDMRKTFSRLKPAIRFIVQLSARRARVLFNNPDRRIMSIFIMQKFSYLLKFFYFTRRKLPGILTNFFRLRVGFSKKFKSLKRFPSMVFSVDAYDHHVGSEAAILGLPVLNIFDSNTNFFLNHSYNVPGNDDSFIARRFYYNTVCRAILAGLVRFAFYRRMRIFKKMKSVLRLRDKLRLNIDYFSMCCRLPKIHSMVKELGIINSKFGSLRALINNGKAVFIPNNQLFSYEKKKKLDSLPIFIENYIPDLNSNKKDFFINLFTNSLIGSKSQYYFFRYSAQLAIKAKVKNIRNLRRKKKLWRVNYRMIKRLKPSISNLFSFSHIALLLNRKMNYKGFGYLGLVHRRHLLKRLPFFKKLFPLFKRFFRLGSNDMNYGTLNFFLFRRILHFLTRKYALYLFIKRLKFSHGKYAVYKKLIKRGKNKYDRYGSGKFKFKRFSHSRHNNKNRQKHIW
jgi:ribosomal protein S2